MFQKLKNLNHYILKVLLYGFVIMLIGNNSAYAEFKCPKTGGIFKTVDLAYPSMDAGVRANPVYYSFLIYDSLLDMTYDLGVKPGLATEVPKKASDGSYTFKLRKGVKFHDGTEFNAKAVAFNVDRLKSGKISVSSPIGKGLLGKKVGEIAEVVVPNGTIKFEIISIER